MSYTRQQKREVFRKLNDPVKLKRIITADENKRKRELDVFRKSKARKRAIIAICCLVVLTAAALYWG